MKSSLFAVLLSFSLRAAELISPYADLNAVLPFDGHGWYKNASQMESLIKRRRPTVVVEVGSWLGKSTRHIAKLLPPNGMVYAVDHWKGSKEHQEGQGCYYKALPYLYEQFLSNVIHAGLTKKIVPIRMSSQDAAKTLKGPIDLVYIDAAHDMQSVYADLDAWYPFVKESGVLCGDDWWSPEIKKAVYQFAQKKNLLVYGEKNFFELRKQSGDYTRLDELCNHVRHCLQRASRGSSSLSVSVLKRRGSLQPRLFHFVNNLSLKPGIEIHFFGRDADALSSAVYRSNMWKREAQDLVFFYSDKVDVGDLSIARSPTILIAKQKHRFELRGQLSAHGFEPVKEWTLFTKPHFGEYFITVARAKNYK